jgi:GT2 family glycosyltransferase
MQNTLQDAVDNYAIDDVTVSIVTYNSRAVIQQCLAALPDSLLVRVFDNASSDDTVEMVRTLFPHVELSASATNLGFGRGHNHNLKQITTPFALVLNPDCFVTAGAINALADVMRQRPLIAMAGPFAQSGGRSTRPDSVDAAVTHRQSDRVQADPVQADTIGGHCLLLRMTVGHQVGFFDPGLFLFCEDTDLCTKVSRNGFQLVHVPQAEVRHLGASSSGHGLRKVARREFHMGWSKSYYRCKYRDDRSVRSVLFKETLIHSRKALIRTLRLSPRVMEPLCRLAGVFAFWSNPPDITADQRIRQNESHGATDSTERRKAA